MIHWNEAISSKNSAIVLLGKFINQFWDRDSEPVIIDFANEMCYVKVCKRSHNAVFSSGRCHGQSQRARGPSRLDRTFPVIDHGRRYYLLIVRQALYRWLGRVVCGHLNRSWVMGGGEGYVRQAERFHFTPAMPLHELSWSSATLLSAWRQGNEDKQPGLGDLHRTDATDDAVRLARQYWWRWAGFEISGGWTLAGVPRGTPFR